MAKKILLVGATGKLGKAIQSLEKPIAFSGLIHRSNLNAVHLFFKDSQVVLDVSQPKVACEILKVLLKQKLRMPVVLGCTGWTSAQLKQVRNYSKMAPVILAPNFSPIVSLLTHFFAQHADLLKELGYSSEITDVHHKLKKDKPSGTAKAFAEALLAIKPKISSFRKGKVVGTHTVALLGKWDELKIIHIAKNRTLFAQGAIKAAKWLMHTNREPGMYSMNDVLFKK